MQIYFESSLWKEKGDAPCECRKYIHSLFMEGGLERCIPIIYCFPKGIVFDILTVMDTEKLRCYYETYKNTAKHAAAMSDAHVREIMQHNPYQDVEIEQMWINERTVKRRTSSSSGTIPFQEKQSKKEQVLFKHIQELYADFLGGTECFFCQRICVETPVDYTVQQLKRIKIKTREKQQVFSFRQEMELEAGEEGKLQMVHPVTNETHQIYLYDIQMSGELPLEENRIAYFVGTAEVVPKLQTEESLLFDSTIPYSARPKKAGAVSIIGGQSGPTAVFMAGIETEAKTRYGGTVFPCFSKPFVLADDENKVIEKGRFCIRGMEKTISQGEWIEIYNIEMPGSKGKIPFDPNLI